MTRQNLRPPPRSFSSLLLVLLTATTTSICHVDSALSTPRPPFHFLDRYTVRRPPPNAAAEPKEYIDPTSPPLLPDATPICSLSLLQHDFAYTYGSPPAVANFTPPGDDLCPGWTRAVLEFSASCAGDQYDRIAAVWIDGVEVLRTSTAEPTEAGIFWTVRKEVTRYSSLLRPSSSNSSSIDGEEDEVRVVTLMLENIVNDVYTGIYHVNLSLHLYPKGAVAGGGGARKSGFLRRGSSDSIGNIRKLGMWSEDETRVPPLRGSDLELMDSKVVASRDSSIKLNTMLELDDSSMPFVPGQAIPEESFVDFYGRPADLIIPISSDNPDDGSWFRIQNSAGVHTRSVRIPPNAHRAVLEIFVSFHGDDEFWYSNPPNFYIEQNNIQTARGNGSFREVVATIDGLFVGAVVPFPVIFTGGINPLFWEPVVAIGAFDLPSYKVELTPFLGNLLDGELHQFGLSVTHGISFWLVDANLHLWLDPHASSVEAKLVKYKDPEAEYDRDADFENLDGEFEIEVEREFIISGWVKSSLGNITTSLKQELDFESTVEFKNNGNRKKVKTKSKAKIKATVEENGILLAEFYHKTKFPLEFTSETFPGAGPEKYKLTTDLSHEFYDESSVKLGGVTYATVVSDSQSCAGWMEVEDHSVLAGSTSTNQSYSYKDNINCYARTIAVRDGEIQKDQTCSFCPLDM